MLKTIIFYFCRLQTVPSKVKKDNFFSKYRQIWSHSFIYRQACILALVMFKIDFSPKFSQSVQFFVNLAHLRSFYDFFYCQQFRYFITVSIFISIEMHWPLVEDQNDPIIDFSWTFDLLNDILVSQNGRIWNSFKIITPIF